MVCRIKMSFYVNIKNFNLVYYFLTLKKYFKKFVNNCIELLNTIKFYIDLDSLRSCVGNGID